MSESFLQKDDIDRLFRLLNSELEKDHVKGEVYLVGGAVMCLALNARPATRDIDAFFVPKETVRKAAARVGRAANVGESWLNDAVKGFLSDGGTFQPYLELSNLQVLTAQPEYLLAMKCLAFRIGEEFTDENDIRFLLRYLNVESYDKALEILGRYYPLDKFPQKTFYALEEILMRQKK